MSTFRAPLDKGSHAGLLSLLRVIPREEIGRMGRQQGGEHRSTTVTPGQQRSLGPDCDASPRRATESLSARYRVPSR